MRGSSRVSGLFPLWCADRCSAASMPDRKREATMRTAKRSAIALVLVVVACLLAPEAVPARLIFDPADPAFTGATVVPLTLSNLGLSNATPILTFSTLQNGVTFGFSTTAAAGMFPTGGGISGAPIL